MPRRFCDWAGCRNPATTYVDGYHHCQPHLREHHRLIAEQERILARPLQYRPKSDRIAECGTRSGFQRHKRLGEEPCRPCRVMESEYQRIRQQRRTSALRDVAAGPDGRRKGDFAQGGTGGDAA